MNDVLKKLGLSDHRTKFVEEKILTDIVFYLSIEDFLKLGLADRNTTCHLESNVQLSVYALHKGQLELTNL